MVARKSRGWSCSGAPITVHIHINIICLCQCHDVIGIYPNLRSCYPTIHEFTKSKLRNNAIYSDNVVVLTTSLLGIIHNSHTIVDRYASQCSSNDKRHDHLSPQTPLHHMSMSISAIASISSSKLGSATGALFICLPVTTTGPALTCSISCSASNASRSSSSSAG